MKRNNPYAQARPYLPDPRLEADVQPQTPRQVRTVEGALEHRIVAGDRLDLLARHYYNDDRLWRHIADANPDFFYAADALDDAQIGRILIIPPL